MKLTDKFTQALAYAERLHRNQTRKGNDIPYVAHLLAVCATVLEHGGDEDVAIAALLHDAVEDQGGEKTQSAIEAMFEPRVARIVAACTDTTSADPSTKAPWEERKRRHIVKLATVDADVALVTAADKLHNLTAIIRDVRRDGPETLSRFNAGPDQQLWYFTAVAAAIGRHRAVAPVGEIEEGVQVLASLLNIAVPKLEPAACDGGPAGGGESASKKTINDLIREKPELFDYEDCRPPSESNYWPSDPDSTLSPAVRERLKQLGKYDEYIAEGKRRAAEARRRATE
jgi:HD domain